MFKKLRNWESLYSDTLNSTFICSSSNPEESIFSPVFTPGVLYNPIFFFSLFVNTISNQKHSMVGQLKRIKVTHSTSKELGNLCVMVDSSLVQHKVRFNLERNSQRTIMNKCQNHCILTTGSIVTTNIGVRSCVMSGAGLLRIYVTGSISLFIGVTGFFNKPIILSIPSSNEVWESSRTTLRILWIVVSY